MRDVWRFLAALYRDWLNRMSGIASIILGALGATLDTAVPSWTFWVAAVVCLLFACFRVWQEEHRKAFDQEKRAATRAVLGKLLAEANQLRERIYRENDQSLRDQAHVWLGRATEFIQANMGEDAVARFNSDAGVPPSFSGSYESPEQVKWCGVLRVRAVRLNEFISELNR